MIPPPSEPSAYIFRGDPATFRSSLSRETTAGIELSIRTAVSSPPKRNVEESVRSLRLTDPRENGKLQLSLIAPGVE
jgi:hypothetical protein